MESDTFKVMEEGADDCNKVDALDKKELLWRKRSRFVKAQTFESPAFIAQGFGTKNSETPGPIIGFAKNNSSEISMLPYALKARQNSESTLINKKGASEIEMNEKEDGSTTTNQDAKPSDTDSTSKDKKKIRITLKRKKEP